MTKKFLITVFIISLISCFFENIGQAFFIYAQSDLESTIGEQLKDLDLDSLNNLFNNSYANFSFKELFNSVLNGQFSFDGSSFLGYIFNLFKDSSKAILAPFIFIFVICVLGYILRNISSEKVSSSVQNVIHLALICIISGIVIKLIFNVVLNVKDIFSLLQKVMGISFPIILTLMAVSGAKATVAIYQPIMALLSTTIIECFINILLPIFIVVLVLNVADSLTDNVKLSNFSNMLYKIYKWCIGIIFGLFTSIVGVFGITAGSYDSISFKTAQYSIKNYIPFVGSYLSGGFNIIACSSILIKNSLGLACFIMVLITAIKPIVDILLIKLFLSLISSTLENIADKKTLVFCNSISKSLNMLIAIIAVVCAMFLVFMSLCIATGNIM